MFYAIDFDSRSVESKSEDGDLLAEYILDNDLQMAVALVESVDDLVLEFSLNELQGLYDSMTDHPKRFDDDDHAAQVCFAMLEANQEDFPNFTPKLGKKLLKQAVQERSEKRSVKGKAKAPTKAKKPTEGNSGGGRITAKQLRGKMFKSGEVVPRQGIDRWFLIEFIEDNLGEASYEELIAHYKIRGEEKKNKPVSDSEAHSKIVSALRKSNIEEIV